MKTTSYMRTLKVAASSILISGAISLLGSPLAHAALLTVGASSPPYGGFVCADVRNASSTSGTPVQAFDCLGDLNEQFEFIGEQIFALGGTRCLDVSGSLTVVSNTCSSSSASQRWYFIDGEIVNIKYGDCLDATNMANNTQLVINQCNTSVRSQNWQIK